ncbi:MAG: hypothetical protein HY534_06730 [Chloroflexi bacterium]|nr:hypothetical protein [Betaproteobacteria bacterium]MBI4213990.1 hypothetical protein [Chloroflexota bacterium]
MERQFLVDLREASLAVAFLGVTVLGLYWLIAGEVPWSFLIGEVIGLGLGIGLLMVAGPRRRRP